MPLASWYDGEWDVTRLGGVDLPGVVTVDVKLKANIDRQKATGKRKSRSRDKGDSQNQVTIVITMTPDERDQFAEIVPFLDPGRRRGVRDPLDLEHPNAALWGVQSIIIHEIDSPQPAPGGFWIVTINAEEWTPDAAAGKPVKPGKQKPKGADVPNYVDEFLNAGKPPEGPPDLIHEFRPTGDPPLIGPPPPPPPPEFAPANGPPSNSAEDGLGFPEFS